MTNAVVSTRIECKEFVNVAFELVAEHAIVNTLH